MEITKYGSWVGGINIKPQDISEETYNEYFDTEAIEYDTVTSLIEHGEKTGEVLSASYLQEPYRDMIKDAIINEGTTSSIGWYMPDWYMNVKCTIDGVDFAFEDLDDVSREYIIDGILNNGWKMGELCVSYDIDVTVDEKITDGYISGTVECYGETCGFDYNIETEEIDLHKYSTPGWITGACYETELPKTLQSVVEEIYDCINEKVSDYLENIECENDEQSHNSLDSLINDAEQETQGGKNIDEKAKDENER